MGTHIHSFRRVLLTTVTLAVALSGCAMTEMMGEKIERPAKPVIGSPARAPAPASAQDAMLAAPPPGDETGNGSRRVPLGQLAANAPTNPNEFVPAPVPASASAPAPTASAPMLLVPASANIDPMDAPPPPTVVAQAPQPAPKAEAPKPAAPAAPVTAATPPAASPPAPVPAAAKPALERPSSGPIGPIASAPQPETLQRMATAKGTTSAKAKAASVPPAAQPAPSPPPVVAVAPPAPAEPPVAKAEPAPAVKPEPAAVVAKAEPQPAPQLKLNIPPRGSQPRELIAEPQDTVVISSSSTAPINDTREFIPATLMASAAPAPMSAVPGGMTARPLSAVEKNVAQRFEVLKALLDEDLVTPDEYMHHRNANLGALLPYTHDPAAVGLERPAPSADAVVARLEALRRSLEMRAISTRQHAMERSMILNALLPDAPMDRMPDMPPPEDLIQATTLISHLQTLRNRSLISANEFDNERKAIESYLKTGKMPVSASRTDATARAAQAAAAKQAEDAKAAVAAKEKQAQASVMSAEEELTSPVPGPVLHLASFRTKEAANKGWQEAVDRNKALLGSVKEIVRKIDLGQQRGVFYRLMAGPYPSLGAAETACIALKQANQFCRASADGS